MRDVSSVKPDLTNFAATLLQAMGLEALPSMSQPVTSLVETIKNRAGGSIQKALIFHADAVGENTVERNPTLFKDLCGVTQITREFRAVMPSITPVCFAAMYSGVYPDKNGVPEYKPPILSETLIQPRITCQTVIEALVRSDKKVAVVTCSDGCIASMLYGRGADMFIIPGDDDELMYQKARELLNKDIYDVIFLYQLSFDHTMHAYGPESREAISVLETLTDRFRTLANDVEKIWSAYPRLTVFNADHGSHTVELTHGAHGDDIAQDIEMKWFWGAFAAEG